MRLVAVSSCCRFGGLGWVWFLLVTWAFSGTNPRNRPKAEAITQNTDLMLSVINGAYPEIPTLAATPTFRAVRRADAMLALLGRDLSAAKPSREPDLGPRDRAHPLAKEELSETEP